MYIFAHVVEYMYIVYILVVCKCIREQYVHLYLHSHSHSSKIMKEKLLMSITSGAGFEMS